MIVGINGNLIGKSSSEAIIECNGIEYSVFISLNTSETLPEIGSKTRLLTILVPKEDSLSLYGFASDGERELFKLLTSIGGIGPKIAMGILSSVTVSDFQKVIISGNLVALTKLPGVGKKTAERILLELRDKILKLGVLVDSSLDGTSNMLKQEAMSALITLGYSRLVAEKAIIQVFSESGTEKLTAENIIKKALRYAIQ